MRIPLYQVDAFADRLFTGNPAAVCPLESWLDDVTLAAIARENNLSETAFLVPSCEAQTADWDLRWFTPGAEVDLCGHATLAAAWVVFNRIWAASTPDARTVRFQTKSGVLTVERAAETGLTGDGSADSLTMDFPARPAAPIEAPPKLARALGRAPLEVLAAKYLLAVFATETQVAELAPDMAGLVGVGTPVIATAPAHPNSDGIDFVSRYFAPTVGVPEDPVTGSAHCTLAPYWAGRLGRAVLTGRQISARTGVVHCALSGDRVSLSGRAVPYLEGTLQLT